MAEDCALCRPGQKRYQNVRHEVVPCFQYAYLPGAYRAMRFLENTDLLKIEDILPFFPDFVVIDDFKEEIAHALEGYAAEIERLKSEMDEATRTAEVIKEDIAALSNRSITISAAALCEVCTQSLMTRQFYVFPCRHSFHADCLIGLVSRIAHYPRSSYRLNPFLRKVKEYLPAASLRRILALQTELIKGTQDSAKVANGQARHPTTQRTLLSANFANLANPLVEGGRAAGSLGRNILSAGDRLRDLIIPDALASVVSAPTWIPGLGFGSGAKSVVDDGGRRAEKLRAELDDLLSSNCPLCESVVATLDRPFVAPGEVDVTWAL
jgi:vacuolar protein sorting-associated protein 18